MLKNGMAYQTRCSTWSAEQPAATQQKTGHVPVFCCCKPQATSYKLQATSIDSMGLIFGFGFGFGFGFKLEA